MYQNRRVVIKERYGVEEPVYAGLRILAHKIWPPGLRVNTSVLKIIAHLCFCALKKYSTLILAHRAASCLIPSDNAKSFISVLMVLNRQYLLF